MVKYFLFFLAFILVAGPAANGQSFYRLQYRSIQAGEPDEDAFLIVYTDGTALMRSRTAGTVNESLITEFILEERYIRSKEGNPVDDYKYYETKSLRKVRGSGTNPAPLRIWFKLNEATGFLEPWAISTADKPDDIPTENNLDTAELLEADALKKSLVLNYFSQREDIYTTLFATRVRGLSPAEKKIKLRLLVVANTNDKVIGSSCRFDMNRMTEAFTDITEYLGIGFTADTIAGNLFNKKNVMGAVEKLKASPADILVFYYTGHGFRKPADKRNYPYLELRGKGEKDYMINSVNIEDIYEMLRGNTKARLKLVIGDCCNSEVDVSNALGSPVSEEKGSGLDWNEANIKQLFFNSRKAILATSAGVGQLAASNNKFGGFFSYFFKTAMLSNFSIFKKNVTWDHVLQDAKKRTIKKAQNTCCEKPCSAATACRQTPGYIIRL